MSILFCFMRAWLIGFAIAAPIGPIGMLCIKKTLELGFAGTIAVAIGASCADSIYGAIAAFGLSSVSNFLIEKTVLIKFIGGIFLLYLAYSEFKKDNIVLGDLKKIDIDKNISTHLPIHVFFLTLTNPMTILAFIGVFSTITINHLSTLEALATVFGIFVGTNTWWLILGSIVMRLREKLPQIWLQRVKYISVIIIGGFGFFSLFKAIMSP